MYNFTFDWNKHYNDEQIAVSTVSHGEDIFEHTHSFLEIVYTHGGDSIHYIDDVPYHTKHGDILFIGIGQRHKIELKQDKTDITDVLVNPTFIDEILSRMENPMDILALSAFETYNDKIDRMIPHVHLRGNDVMQAENIIRCMDEEYVNKDLNYKTSLKSYIVVLLNLIFRTMYKQQSGLALHHLNRITPDILRYIDDNLQEKLTLRQLAEKTFYNPSYFSKIFKDCYGKSFVDYLNDKRLEKAAEMLCDTDMTLEDISATCGFSNSKYFSKLFKQRYAQTPGRYRIENTGK